MAHIHKREDTGPTGFERAPGPDHRRDIELVSAGILSPFAGGAWSMRPDGSISVVPPGIFVLPTLLSLWLAWVDIRARGGLSIRREE